ncbi:hypothetical protein MTO96_021949 [Rhipicephalus appendiculatus]
MLTDSFGLWDLLVDHLLTLSPGKSSSEFPKLCLLHDNVQLLVGTLEGLGASPDQCTKVLNCVLMRYLPEDLATMYWQKTKEVNCTSSIAEFPEDRMWLAKKILTFPLHPSGNRKEGWLQSRRVLQEESQDTHV